MLEGGIGCKGVNPRPVAEKRDTDGAPGRPSNVHLLKPRGPGITDSHPLFRKVRETKDGAPIFRNGSRTPVPEWFRRASCCRDRILERLDRMERWFDHVRRVEGR